MDTTQNQSSIDRFSGAVKNIQSSAADLLQTSADVVARTGLDERSAHEIVSNTFRQANQSQPSREPSWSSQNR